MTEQARDRGQNAVRVRVNGARLSDEQLAELEAQYGNRPLPGDYWYDPRSGLYGIARQPAMGGGDNIWSTRFGAGNFDSGGQRGYVSVPGHGPIGYGF